MAVNLYPPFKLRIESLGSESGFYRRRSKRLPTKKIQRRFRIKIRHAAFSLVLVAGLFTGVQQGLFVLMRWDRLDIDRIEVACRKPELREAAARYLEQRISGNLLFLDIDRVRRALEAHSQIKSVRVRKHFPSTLRIEISERVPAALLGGPGLVLIDREGVELAPTPSRQGWDLPLFVDSGSFQRERQARLELAWGFLAELRPQDRAAIDTVDVSCFSNVAVKRKDFPAWLYFGKDRFKEKMNNFRSERNYLAARSSLEYVDLSRADRIIFAPVTASSGPLLVPERR
jgi:cell division septal protein FtsQ